MDKELTTTFLTFEELTMMDFFDPALGKKKQTAEQYEPAHPPKASTPDQDNKETPNKPAHGEDGACCGACGGK